MYSARIKDEKAARSPEEEEEDVVYIFDDAVEDVEVVLDVDEVPAQKPHFLDIDAVPPPDFEETFDRVLSFGNTKTSPDDATSSGEQLKVDKKFERDGEISDYELAASGYTKKEFTQDDNTLHLIGASANICGRTSSKKKSKHFLDENPIPPDYMLVPEMREHRSLDRNFERHNEQRSESPSSSGPFSLSARKSSSASRSSRDFVKEPSYTLSRFLDSDAQGVCSPMSLPPPITQQHIPRGAAWTESYSSYYNSLQPLSSDALSDVDSAMGSKVECVYSLLSMLGSNDPLEMSKKFLELSKTSESCAALRRAGCIPLLVQMMYSDSNENVQKCASLALHNVVHSSYDEKVGRREAKVLRLLDQIMDYCGFLKTLLQSGGEAIADDSERHPLAAMSSLMKVSFDEEHRHAMCELGALQAIPNLVHLDHAVHGPKPDDQCCNSLRRYALMALTNLTFGDENNKALLCSQKLFMEALVAQLDCAPDDLLQVTASVLRNLSWRADSSMKAILNEIGTVTALAKAAMKNKNENTLKAILSALWNLSAHCSTNKAEFCAVDGALAFLVKMLTYEGPSKTLKIIENAGGILRNVSSHIAVRENYRQILREHNCLSILLQQLKSESLTVVSNSCGTLWNLSARCPEDQKFLWDNGAVPMLRSLIHSKHTMISEGSSSALKNLLNFRPSVQNQNPLDPVARSMNLKKLPTLNARKQKALELELGRKVHSETCDNLDVHPVAKDNTNNYELSAIRRYPLAAAISAGADVVPSSNALNSTSSARLTRSAMLAKSESRDSILSAKSDSVYENHLRSHSASSVNQITNSSRSQCKAFELENDAEVNEEHPIDYSVKYNEKLGKKAMTKVEKPTSNSPEVATNYPTYQETDLDQPTDFSLRYAENQLESDADISPQDVANVNAPMSSLERQRKQIKETQHKSQCKDANGIILTLDDTVKCYQTEDTPYVISNAASVSDLRQSKAESFENEPTKIRPVPTKKMHRTSQYASGSFTPEKPISYAEEGTPGYFSRYESLSSLDESPPQCDKANAVETHKKPKDEAKSSHEMKMQKNKNEEMPASKKEIMPENAVETNDNVLSLPITNMNSAQETPLMFSRHSSMDSLAEEDVGPLDDKSSVVSDFSRLASGIISPSEIPDSPTQSMPQSPRRHSATAPPNCYSEGVSPITPRSSNARITGIQSKKPLRSVFEDDFNTFHVENTPAQFSCATSLSNLSILDDEKISPPAKDQTARSSTENAALSSNLISEEEEEEPSNNNDDLLLANCINMGMNRTSTGNVLPKKQLLQQIAATTDEPRQYYTEDTPAFLSKVGSNSNLSAISICSSSNNQKIEGLGDIDNSLENQNNKRQSLNLSDDVSSNASESGATALSYNILQQCILDGMQKPTHQHANAAPANENKEEAMEEPVVNKMSSLDPIAMMRKGGNALPSYLGVKDEMNKYLVEDSPCNFSVMSGLSNLTVGSSRVGPAVHLNEKKPSNANEMLDSKKDEQLNKPNASKFHTGDAMPNPNASKEKNEEIPLENRWNDDSLSSLSIDSEDDTNLLSQAIAAGCNRPKSNLGFSSSSMNASGKRSTSLSSSQPIPINAATSASSLNSVVTVRNFQRQNQSKRKSHIHPNNNNESYSSVDSSDSNDNQSKSLFELCIISGMHKSSSSSHSHNKHVSNIRMKADGDGASATQSNPNLKVFDNKNSPMSSTSSNRHFRDREKKDEKLLMECINTGISKKVSSGSLSKSSMENQKPMKQTTRSESHSNAEELLVNGSKNVEATSVAAQAVYPRMEDTTLTNAHNTAAPGVETNTDLTPQMKLNNIIYSNSNSCRQENTIADPGNQCQPTAQSADSQNNKIPKENHQSPENDLSNGIGYEKLTAYKSLEHIPSDDSNQSFIMDTTVSLERVAEVSNQCKAPLDKHKDPDLMLKSVERLTLEFVTSAEQLRTSSIYGKPKELAHPKTSHKPLNGTNSNNTWNEDTCPNDVSFPSISLTAPAITSLSLDDNLDEDITEADHKDLHEFSEITQNEENERYDECFITYTNEIDGQYNPFESLPTETNTTMVNEATELNGDFEENSSNSKEKLGINFQLGGEVQSAVASLTNKNLLLNCNSAMTNSTILAIEARALAENLQRTASSIDDNTDMTFSINSLELDNIRPPSGMESLSGFYQDPPMFHSQPNSIQRSFLPQSPQFSNRSPKFPRKALPAGFVARRALGQLPGHLLGSNESVNSSCNLLDNIKPPSLMDELLDSMMSVASIQSEIADADCQSMATTVSISNYETAATNDFDDNTITLQSCCDLTLQDDDEASQCSGTPLPLDNDFQSPEMTPKKLQPSSPLGVKRTLTPKQKRKNAQDRYKTYTIAADFVMNEQPTAEEPDETFSIEIIEHDLTKTSENFVSLQFNGNTFKRRGSQERYKTQDIVCPIEILQQPQPQPQQETIKTENEAMENENFSLTSTEECLSEEMSSIRAMTHRFKYITSTSPHHSEDKSTKPTLSKEELNEDNGKNLEVDQSSETESCHYQNNDEPLSDIESENENDKLPKEIKKPRIVNKPSNENEDDDHLDVEDEAKAKAIRGKKKPAYVSPYSMQFQRKTEVKAFTNIVDATKKRFSSTKTSSTTTTSKIAQRKKISEKASPSNSNLQRQGTFVKDESPTHVPIQIPEVNSSTTNRKLSKLPTKSNSNSPKKSNLATTRKIDSTLSPSKMINRKTLLSSSAKQMAYRSNSNTSLQISSNAARIAVLSSRVSSTTPPSRSNSNLNGMTSAAAAAVKVSQAQSRIASIWKKVDAAKAKQIPPKPVKTVYATTTTASKITSPKRTLSARQPASSQLKSSNLQSAGGNARKTQSNLHLVAKDKATKAPAPAPAKQICQDETSTPQLVRSSTFDAIPTITTELPNVVPPAAKPTTSNTNLSNTKILYNKKTIQRTTLPISVRK